MVVQTAWRDAIKEITKELENVPGNLQNIHTPFDLCTKVVDKLKEYMGDFAGKEFCVFNLEFIEVLCYNFGVQKEKIWFVTDCKEKAAIAKSSRYQGVNVMQEDFFEMLKKKNEGKKFDVVVGNPPYQDPNNKGVPLWVKFVKKSLGLSKDNGYIALIHPSSWRRPLHELHDDLFYRQMQYLEIHNQQDGMRNFGCGTRYDWYILQNSKNHKNTIVIDEDGQTSSLNFFKQNFIPHACLDILEKCLAKNREDKCKVIYSRTMYGHDKAWMSVTKHDKFEYPCVRATPCTKIPTIIYSSKKEGHFGISKVIIGVASPENCFYDSEGEYGISDGCFGIITNNKIEANNIINVLSSDKFRKIIDSCKWAGFAMEFKIFQSFKRDFWKEFLK